MGEVWALLKAWCPCLWWLTREPKDKYNEPSRGPTMEHCSPHLENVLKDRRQSVSGVGSSRNTWKIGHPLSVDRTNRAEAQQIHNSQFTDRPSLLDGRVHADDDLLPHKTPDIRNPVSNPYKITSHSYDSEFVRETAGGVYCIPEDSSIELSTPRASRDKFLVNAQGSPQIVGLDNTNSKYLPHQRIPLRGTPFTERMEDEICRERGAMQSLKRRAKNDQHD